MARIKVKTSELTGAALDWAVAEADGLRPYPHKGGFWVLDGKTNAPLPPFSTDWAHGGPLIDKYNIWLSGPIGERKEWSAAIDLSTDDVRGDTALIALCRALVESKSGDEVWVPAELMVVAA
jgi:hypothetical protein